jgi:hypothetical protein
VLACAVLLALPASALAQSAGDNQYTDPFSGQSQGGGGNSGGGNAQASPQTAQAAPAAPSATASQAQQPDQGAALPRTGFPTLLPLAYGLVLLLGGVALRRGARPRIQ